MPEEMKIMHTTFKRHILSHICKGHSRSLVTASSTNIARLTCDVEAEDLSRYCPGGYHPVHFVDVFKDGRYEILNKLGFGSYSTVWAARDKSVQRNVALKIGTSEDQAADRETRSLQLCTQSAPEVGSQFVPKLLDSFHHTGPNGQHVCLVLDILGPSVPVVIENKLSIPRLPKKIATKIVGEVLSGLTFLHKLGLGHGDLHTGNICFTEPKLAHMSSTELLRILKKPKTGIIYGKTPNEGCSGVPDYLVWPSSIPHEQISLTEPIKIIDFGQSFTKSSRPKTLRTPLVLRPPEILFEDDWDYRVDLWSIGCTIFELITGQPPFDSMMATKDTIVSQMRELIGELPSKWNDARTSSTAGKLDSAPELQEWLGELYFESELQPEFSKKELRDAGKIIQGLMRYEPSERMAAAEALRRWKISFSSAPMRR